MAKKKELKSEKHVTALARVKKCIDSSTHIREQSIEDLEFVEGDQWDEDDRRDREENGRPTIVINKLQAVVKQIVNDGRQNTPSIKVRPVDRSGDADIADIYTGLIKNIENESDADAVYDYSFECAVKSGFGCFRVLTEYSRDDAFDQDICIERIENPFSVLIDPSAKKPDRSDMRYAFVVDKMPVEDFKEEFPGKSPISLDVTGFEQADESEEYVYIAEYWRKEKTKRTLYSLQDGRVIWKDEVPEEIIDELMQFVTREKSVDVDKVIVCKISGAETLEEDSDWAGKYIPIIPVLGEEVWIEGRCYLRSAIFHAKDAQRLYNWSRSTTVETLAMTPRQPLMVTADQIEGHEDQWDDLNTKPKPYLVYNNDGNGAPHRAGMSIPDQGAMSEMMASSDDIKSTTGIYDASLGARGNETSGRAIIARQREGDTATFAFHDNLARSIKYCGKILVDLIPKIYDAEREVRILGKDQQEKIVKINQPDAAGNVLNDIQRGKYDVVISTGPSYQTMRMEAADAMVNMLQAMPQAAPVFAPRIAKVMDFPDADQIAEELQKLFNPQAQGPDPAQQQMMQAQMQAQMQAVAMKQQADQMKMQADMQKAQIDMQKGQIALQQGQADLAKTVQEIEGQKLDNVKTQLEIKSQLEENAKAMMEMRGVLGQLIGR